MENGCLIELIERLRKNDMSVFPVIFSEFEGLIYHYKAKCQAEDIYEELSVFLLELLYKTDIKRFKNIAGDGLKRYIAVSLRNRYIAYSNADELFKRLNKFCDLKRTFSEDFSENTLLNDAVMGLSKKQKQVIALKYIYNYRDVEIAEKLGITRQAVNRIKNRGVQALREYFK